MSRKKLWFIIILVMSVSFISTNVFAGETQGDSFEIWPVYIDPPNGSEDIYVPEGQDIVIRSSFTACSRPASKTWTKLDRVTLAVDGESLVSSRNESRRSWSNPSVIPNDGIPCVNDSDKLWVVVWAYELGALEAGIYPVHYTENVKHFFTDGADYDGDGLPDFFSWHITVDFNIVVLPEMGNISGAVTTINEAGDEVPVVGIWVDACEESVPADQWGSHPLCNGAATDGNGIYTITTLQPGNYRVVIWGDESYVPQFFDHVFGYDDAELVEVIVEETTENIDFELILGGFISGTVTDASEDPVVGIWVDACEENVSGEEWGSHHLCNGAATDDDGFYTITALQPGNYRVVIWGDEAFTPEFYDDTLSYYEATLVPVVGGLPSEDIDFMLTAPVPIFAAYSNDDYVDGWEWAEGSSVTLSIDDPENGPGADYTDTQIVTIAEWDPDITHVQFNFQGIFDLQPEFIVTLTDADYIKQHIVTDLAITEVDPDADLVLGTAAPGSHVYAWIYGDAGRVDRHEIADPAGIWAADFSDPGDEPGEEMTFDIFPGTGGEANQVDVDGDVTQVNWWIPEPYVPHPGFLVNLTSSEVHGWEWPAEAEVTLDIYAPDGSPVHTQTAIAELTGTEPWETFTWFSFPPELGVGTNYRVTLFDGETFKEHIVTSLALLDVDEAADTVSGTTEPGAEVIVDAWLGAMRRAVADGEGQWMVDFSVQGAEDWEKDIIDLGPEDGGGINQYDDDGDSTNINWWASE